ncbi:MAG: PAS domain-containing protein [Desulfobacterales bacterium]|nr:PAS domain-containing protein [Desulfobacterales bacterium]
MKKQKFPDNFRLVSPLLIAGVLLILLPIFTLMIIDRLDRQKEFFTERLLEKGVSLIRTFEAGTRAGMFTMQWGAKRIQAMLKETSMQPEVIYLMITSNDGQILAHSDAYMVGQFFDAMPEISKIKKDPAFIYHRLREEPGGIALFEVVKKFAPIAPEFRRRQARKHGMSYTRKGKALNQQDAKDWCQPYFQSFDNKIPTLADHYIFAGLSMERAKLARDKLLKETIWRGIIFFLLGCAGIFALFTFQAYRSTRASLDSVKAFSDNVIQNMPAGLITINSEHKITSMNKAAKSIFGEDLTTPYPQMIELIKEMETHHKPFNQEIDFIINPDLTIPLDLTASSIKDTENEIVEFLFLFRDLTQLKELKKQVEKNKRLAAIGKLAAGVAHEIRNPLSSIKGFVTYLGKRHENNTADKETTQIMVGEVERINRSITQLLEFAKPMAVDKKEVNINDMISHSLKLVQSDLDKKKIKTKVDIDTNETKLYTDNDRMNQILLNLYINAIEALETEGTLEIQISDAAENEFIEIRIQDNGDGIDEDSLDQIFDPYFTTKSTGTGLGLSIVHRIIETLEGTIRVESTKGQGTCFIIKLPAS